MPESEPMPEPLHQLIDQINLAAESGLHLIAIGMAVALPAICASLEKEDGRSNGPEYIDWCQNHLMGKNFTFITAEQMYSMRCGVLHGGRADITNKKGSPTKAKNGIGRVIFFPPGPFSVTSGKVNDAYVYSVVEFCKNVGEAVLHWYETNKDESFVGANVRKMMAYHPNGLLPYISGFPAIA